MKCRDGEGLAQSLFHSRSGSGGSCGGVVVCYTGIWWIRSLLEQLVIFQHALVNSRREHGSISNGINEAGRLMQFNSWGLPSGSECPRRMLRFVWLFPQSPPSGKTETSLVKNHNKKIIERWNSAFKSEQWTSSPVQACQGHPHRFGARSLSESFFPLASQHPSDKRTPHSHPASSSSNC